MSSTSKDAVTLRAKRSKKPSDGKMRRNVEIFVLSAPAILLFVCFVILPIVLGAYYGFYQWKGYGLPSKTGKFVGFQNYITALKDPAFQAAILHTFEVVIGSLVIQAPLAILFALLLNQKFKGRGLIRTLIFVPYVVSEVIVGTGWSLLLQKKGAINEILANFGINGPDWLADPKIAIWTLLLLISWKYVGFAVILMLAGMQSIPEELYEAAKSGWGEFLADAEKHHVAVACSDVADLGVPFHDWLSAAFRSGLYRVGQVCVDHRWCVHHGHLHGA